MKIHINYHYQRMETIKNKLLKIKELADRGIDGEKIAAQHRLEQLLAKYNMTIEDIFNEQTKERMFKVSRGQIALFVQFASSEIGDRYKNMYGFKQKPSEIYIELTDREFIDFDQRWQWHRKQYIKEVEKQIDIVKKAYYHKHNLFNKDTDPDDAEKSNITLEEYFQIIGMAAKMENVTFRKQLA